MFPNVMTEEICLEISEQKQTNTTDEIPRENLVLIQLQFNHTASIESLFINDFLFISNTILNRV